MSLSTRVADDGKQVVISISGRFDFNLHREFRLAYENLAGTVGKPRYVVDLGGTEYLDSSALGMLLLLREYAGGDQSDITISNCRSEIKDILDISNFHKLFKIA